MRKYREHLITLVSFASSLSAVYTGQKSVYKPSSMHIAFFQTLKHAFVESDGIYRIPFICNIPNIIITATNIGLDVSQICIRVVWTPLRISPSISPFVLSITIDYAYFEEA